MVSIPISPPNNLTYVHIDCTDGVCRIRPVKTTGGKSAVPLPDTSVEYTVCLEEVRCCDRF